MCTNHSIQRANERTQFSGKSAVRFIENGIARGKTADDFTSKESIYLANCAKGGCTAKAYNGFCLIIGENGDCVTIYQLPDWFGRKRYYDGKKRVRNVKRYTLSHYTTYDLLPA